MFLKNTENSLNIMEEKLCDHRPVGVWTQEKLWPCIVRAQFSWGSPRVNLDHSWHLCLMLELMLNFPFSSAMWSTQFYFLKGRGMKYVPWKISMRRETFCWSTPLKGQLILSLSLWLTFFISLNAVKVSVYEWSENNAMCQSFFFTLFLRVDGIRHFSEFGDIGKYVENTGLAPQTNSSVMGSQ